MSTPPPERAGTRLQSAGAALFSGTLAAGVAAVPAALRVEDVAVAWVTLAGASALVLGPALIGLARARPLPNALFSVLTGLGLAALPLALFAANLKLATHHRPLGAVTFSVVGALVVLAAILVVARVVSLNGSGGGVARWRARLRAGLGIAALLTLSLLAGSVFSAQGARSSVLDVVLGVGCAVLLAAASWPAPLVRVASRAGLPVWVGLVGCGLLLATSQAGAVAREASPALYAAFGWFLP